jgi:hypothetical protein
MIFWCAGGCGACWNLAGRDPEAPGRVSGGQAGSVRRGGAGWLRFLRLIRASSLIRWPPAPPINHRTPINRSLQPEQKIAWGGRQATDEEIVAMTAAEQRLIYDFTIHKAYGRLAV